MTKRRYKLVREKSGVLNVKFYKSDNNYSIKVVNDGVDTVSSVSPEDLAMPSLKVEGKIANVEFPLNSYRLEDVDKIMDTLADLKEFKEDLEELI